MVFVWQRAGPTPTVRFVQENVEVSKSKTQLPADERRDEAAMDIAHAIANYLGRTVMLANVGGTDVVVKPRAGPTLDS